MSLERCPRCHVLTNAENTVLLSDGKRETLYRCRSHTCGTLFAHALSPTHQLAAGVQTYRDRRAPSEQILTDC
ncbi:MULTISPECIES: hypothetical protein [Ralstonia solanacearum species complex]|uniref:Uncharacterized protein n=1 Tax=Ralstonia solanacearum TaxID=305 RepID=A0A0S4V8M0_RALSL|nr:hypothetical protein [Ralstonia pseudosolanacearum]ANH35109.1 hypothetical protein A3768_4290 [Ralstonia solanacearum]AGH86039.1 hypothetical protein F504_3526 [Ralstonia pseudosolanacearum FQY_4]MCF1443384.1 hypothetical protein [Ralstonia solanacearum]MCK4117417.1 hypothetical protein [Ralstonia pseudosolanacearum]MCK4129161.1 hypothetical protein [Ralstonia pseudosolanacearum]